MKERSLGSPLVLAVSSFREATLTYPGQVSGDWIVADPDEEAEIDVFRNCLVTGRILLDPLCLFLSGA